DKMTHLEHEDRHQAGTADLISRRNLLVAAAAVPVVVAGVAGASAQTQRQTPGVATNKAAIVSGSSRGIGAAIARRLAADGYSVTVNCVVNRDLAAGVVRDIEAAGGKAVWEQADVSDPAAVQRLFDANEKAFGGVDVVVSNA